MRRGKFIFITGGARSGKSSFAEKIAADIEKRGRKTAVKGGEQEANDRICEQEKIVENHGQGDVRVTYVATCAPRDGEMMRRIEKHRRNRPQRWRTVEEECRVAEVVREEGMKSEVILLDCLTLLISNLLLGRDFAGDKIESAEKSILSEIKKLAEVARDVPATVIAVSNEVGMGVVPDNEMGRAYRDILGRANQIMAAYADRVYLVVAGIPMEIKTFSE